MSPVTKIAVHRIWCVYNHMPGGHIVATHFETYELKKKMGGDSTETVMFTAENQLEGLRKSKFVQLNVRGKIEKNKVLQYAGSQDLSYDPKAANKVIEWAKAQGVEPIKSAEDSSVGTPVASGTSSADMRINNLERRVTAVDTKLDQILEVITNNQTEKKDDAPESS